MVNSESTAGAAPSPITHHSSRLSIIVAMAQNRTIGINNTLPWRCPEDLRHFKALTMGHHMIMGRKTFESIGKPLPGRTTVVVTRNRELKIEGCLIAHSLEDAIAACAGDEEIFVVGGAELYAQAMPVVDTLYITEIQQNVQGDAHFPEFAKNTWHEVAREPHSQTEPQPLEYHFVTYRRI
jgi:dihydrofolate reductase